MNKQMKLLAIKIWHSPVTKAVTLAFALLGGLTTLLSLKTEIDPLLTPKLEGEYTNSSKEDHDYVAAFIVRNNTEKVWLDVKFIVDDAVGDPAENPNGWHWLAFSGEGVTLTLNPHGEFWHSALISPSEVEKHEHTYVHLMSFDAEGSSNEAVHVLTMKGYFRFTPEINRNLSFWHGLEVVSLPE